MKTFLLSILLVAFLHTNFAFADTVPFGLSSDLSLVLSSQKLQAFANSNKAKLDSVGLYSTGCDNGAVCYSVGFETPAKKTIGEYACIYEKTKNGKKVREIEITSELWMCDSQ